MPTRNIAVHLIAMLCVALFSTAAHAQLRIGSWNTLDGPTSINDPDFVTVLTAIGNESVNGIAQPLDILILQEQAAATAGNIAATLNSIYGVSTYMSSLDPITQNQGDGFDDKLGYVWNSATVNNIAFDGIVTGGPRPAYRGQWQPVGYTSPDSMFYTYSSHFKAGTGFAAARATEAARLRLDGDGLGPGANIIYGGDFNVYSSSEQAFQIMTNSILAPGDGVAVDPKGGSFSLVNDTQDPSSSMNDRFDFQFVSNEMNDQEGLSLINSTAYRAFGNNGTHSFNGPITTGSGAAPNVLSALASAADHLPVVADYQVPSVMSVTNDPIPSQLLLNDGVFTLDVFIENIANVLAVLGADELDYDVNATGDIFGMYSGTVDPLAGQVSHSILFDNSSLGLKSGTITVTATSLGAENALVTIPVSYEVISTKIPGDTDGDGDVDLLDLDALGANFGTLTGATCAEGDFDGDGDVDLLDLDILGANFGTTPSSAVPEPAALALLLLGIACQVGRSRQVVA